VIPMSLSIFGSNIRKVREQKGISVRELAKKVGISYATISNIENGKGSLSFSQRQALCAALNVSTHEMYSTSYERMQIISKIIELYDSVKVDKLQKAQSMCVELIESMVASEERSDLFNLLGKICIMSGEYSKANEAYRNSIEDLKNIGSLDNSMF
jgi:transcriptional regulator with XRE-family HTH domain